MFSQIIKQILKKIYILINSFRYKNCYILSYVPRNCNIGNNITISKNCIIGNKLTIGDHTFINEGVRIDNNTKLIGKFCSISHNVKIGLGPHPSNYISTSPVFYSKNRGFVKEDLYNEYEDKGYTIIEHDVLIGANAIILAGVKIGTGAVIGAGSVVTKDVPPYAMVAGVPAKIIKYRFEPEIIKLLLRSEWWNESIDVLLRYTDLIGKPVAFIQAIGNDRRKG